MTLSCIQARKHLDTPTGVPTRPFSQAQPRGRDMAQGPVRPECLIPGPSVACNCGVGLSKINPEYLAHQRPACSGATSPLPLSARRSYGEERWACRVASSPLPDPCYGPRTPR